ncbi:hypothetical protein CONPUDRAFT_137642 [Coniophora puteana RWD-64-598 SS2]|uniref:Uncharacterized protein n=1 Tax=Coniophora puteana (strain RWD-64-598) TaxID=741705 RepID=A0A5M3MN38_CONPW|nr:uncharacterized protein CONPUDRAFT_137642 [Coniophora puteana RWD-64-598 SS2]EIW80430.1 hypothetical protein CONPUDRAFT_137642 [Coniophora puteana RWD-64-598 SS2]
MSFSFSFNPPFGSSAASASTPNLTSPAAPANTPAPSSTPAVPPGTELFMSVVAQAGFVVNGTSASFEELRVADYLKAYGAIGRPPQPVPQEPAAATARSALGLPPLFTPVPVPLSASVTPSNSGGLGQAAPTSPSAEAQIQNLAQLPVAQAFAPVPVSTTGTLGESFQHISAQGQYSFFSPEELRCHAYATGNKSAPPGLAISTTATTSLLSPLPVSASPGPGILPTAASSEPAFKFANDAPRTAFATSSTASGTPDYMMSICAGQNYDKHSFEELRVAYLLAGRELSSLELGSTIVAPGMPIPPMQPVAPTPTQGSSIFGGGSGGTGGAAATFGGTTTGGGLFGRPRGDTFSLTGA